MGGMRFAFEFGWKTYFRFTFEFGKLPDSACAPASSIGTEDRITPKNEDPIVLYEGSPAPHREGNLVFPEDIIGATALSLNRQLPIMEPSIAIHKPSNPRESIHNRVKDPLEAVRQCCLFQLPLEVRNMIYKLFLVSSNVIEHPASLLDDNQPLFLNDRAKLSGIDAAIARTCRLLNKETRAILYGQNIFVFENADSLRQFAELNMTRKHHYTNQWLGKQSGDPDSWPSRIAFLRCVTIKFQLEQLFTSMRTSDRRRGRDAAWNNWKREVFFQNDSYMKSIKFRSLENLVLDFSGWELSADEGLTVQPLIAKFRDSKKLRRVVVIGIRHEQTLKRLRDGLGQDDRILIAQNAP